MRRLIAALLLLVAGRASANVDGGIPPSGDGGGVAAPATVSGSVPPAVSAPVADRPARSAPGMPAVLSAERAFRGPMIELPPEEGEPAPPTPAPAVAAKPGDEAARTSYFSDIQRKAAAIINRTSIGGYGEFAYTRRAGEDGYFEARRFVALLYSQLTDRISFTTEIEFEHGGSPLKRDGQFVPGEVQLEFAAVDIKLWEQLVLRAGIVLVPFGRFNVNHDAPTQELTDRPLAVTLIVPSTWFEVGAGLFGRQRLSRSWELNWEGYVINGLDSKIQDGLGYRAARGSKLNDNNDDKAVVGRLGAYFFGPLGRYTLQVDVGASGYSGAYDRRGARANLVGGDFTLRVAGLQLICEYMRGFNGAGFDDDFATSTRSPVPSDLQGLFVELQYRFMPEAIRRRLPSWLREATLTLAARYDLVDTDMSVRNVNDRQRVTFAATLRPSPGLAWKNELQLDHTGGPQNPFASPQPGYVTSIAFLF